MSTNVLHGYYQLGGETVRDAAITIGEAFNTRIPGVPLAIQQTVPHVDETDIMRTSVRSYQVPAYHYDDPGKLKLPMFFVKGQSSKVEYVRTMLSQKMPVQSQVRRSTHIPGAPEGDSIVKFLKRQYNLAEVVFNGLCFEYEGLDLARRPMGGIRLLLDVEAPENQSFFSARDQCLKAIKAITPRVMVEVSDSARIGGINLQNTTPRRVETVARSVALELQDKPVVAQIGSFILKNKILDS